MDVDALKRMRVLIVDDDEAGGLLLERILEIEGYTSLRRLAQPQEVIATCAEYGPDLVMLDLHMPVLDGFGVLEGLAPAVLGERQLPVIVVTGAREPESRRRALALGARDFLEKPLDRDETLLRVRNTLMTRASGLFP
jgi:putative two-component system response regulator